MRRSLFLLFLVLSSLLVVTAPVRATAEIVYDESTRYYALSFDGVDDYVKVQSSSSLNFSRTDDYTVIMLARVHITGTYQYLIEKWESGGYPFKFEITPDGRLHVDIYDSSVAKSVTIKDPIRDGEVLFFGARKSRDTWSGILNGQIVGSVDISTLGEWDGSADIYIGSKDGVAFYSYATIYLVLIYNRALSDEEIQQIYNDPLNPPTDGLVLWLAPDSVDTANNVWKDKSDNGNDGTIYGATYVPLRPVSESTPSLETPYGLYFDGQDDYITATMQQEVLTQFTIVSIVNFDEKTLTGDWRQDNDDLFSAYEGGGLRLNFLYEKRENLYLTLKDSELNNYIVKTAYSLSPHKTYLLAITFDAGNVEFYVNNQQVYSTSIGAQNVSAFNTIRIGKRPGDQPFKGKYYIVYFYTRKLSSSEIQQIYENPENPPLDGLVLWYDPYSYDPESGKWLNRAPIFPTIPLVEELDGTNYGATPVRVSIPQLHVYDIETNTEIPIENVSVQLIANNTTISLIPSLLTLPYNETVKLNISATGYQSRGLTLTTPADSIMIYLKRTATMTSTHSLLQPELNITTPTTQFNLTETLPAYRLGELVVKGEWAEAYKEFWHMNVIHEVVLPLIFSIGLIISSYIFSRNPLVTIAVTGVLVVFFKTLGLSLKLSLITPLGTLFVFLVVYALWDFYKNYERG